MTRKSETGKLGEKIACKYLTDKGYKIVEQNHRQKWGELDIVATDPSGVLVLVEVKTVSGYDPYISAEDQMSHAKMEKFKRISHLYANHYFTNRDDSNGWQLDLVTVSLNGNNCRIKHYENIS